MSDFDFSGGFTMGDASGPPVPYGSYVATFDGFEPTTTSKGDTLKWTFTVTVGEHAGHKAAVFIDPGKPTPNNKLGRMLNGLAGKTLSCGENFNPRSVVGKPYKLTIIPGVKGTGMQIIPSLIS